MVFIYLYISGLGHFYCIAMVFFGFVFYCLYYSQSSRGLEFYPSIDNCLIILFPPTWLDVMLPKPKHPFEYSQTIERISTSQVRTLTRSNLPWRYHNHSSIQGPCRLKGLRHHYPHHTLSILTTFNKFLLKSFLELQEFMDIDIESGTLYWSWLPKGRIGLMIRHWYLRTEDKNGRPEYGKGGSRRVTLVLPD